MASDNRDIEYHILNHVVRPKWCACTEREIISFEHKCPLKCIRKEYIEIWFVDRKILQRRALNSFVYDRYIIDIMCLFEYALIYPTKDIGVHIKKLELKYKSDLYGFEQIIHDYRKWVMSEVDKV